jgi:hypothetical protein
MSAFEGEADIRGPRLNVRYRPQTEAEQLSLVRCEKPLPLCWFVPVVTVAALVFATISFAQNASTKIGDSAKGNCDQSRNRRDVTSDMPVNRVADFLLSVFHQKIHRGRVSWLLFFASSLRRRRGVRVGRAHRNGRVFLQASLKLGD